MAFEHSHGSSRIGNREPAGVRYEMFCHRLLRGCAMGAILAGASSIALGLTTRPASADEIIDGGQTVTVPGDHNSPWNIDPDALIVGQSGAGTHRFVLVVGHKDGGQSKPALDIAQFLSG